MMACNRPEAYRGAATGAVELFAAASRAHAGDGQEAPQADAAAPGLATPPAHPASARQEQQDEPLTRPGKHRQTGKGESSSGWRGFSALYERHMSMQHRTFPVCVPAQLYPDPDRE